MCIESIEIIDISMLFCLFYSFSYFVYFEILMSLVHRKNVEMFDGSKKSLRYYAMTYLINNKKRFKIYTRFLLKIDY